MQNRWNAYGNGAGVRVAVVDTGFEGDHPVFQSNVVHNKVVRSSFRRTPWVEEAPATSDRRPRSHHGTCVALSVVGVAPQANLGLIDISGRSFRAHSQLLCEALRWAIDSNFAVINLSYTLPTWRFDRHLLMLCEEAYHRGILIVASRTNSLDTGIPALFSSVLSVTADDAVDPLHLRYCPDSLVEFAANGSRTEFQVRVDRKVSFSGTSKAAAVVSGMCACILEKNPGMRPFDIKSTLRSLASGTRSPL
jgi:hypothetical protein